jgi:regulator of protease activity HflC (stomatin/prohibitin superfamily)
MTWIEVLFRYLRELWPFYIVRSFEQGVRFRFGRDIARLGPGIYFNWWFVESIEIVTVVADVINLPTQTITCKDGKPVTFSANVEYEVEDARKMYCSVTNFGDSLRNAAMGHLAKRVRDWTTADLADSQAELERSLRGTLTTYVRDWGVKIKEVRLTDMVAARAYRLFSDPTLR